MLKRLAFEKEEQKELFTVEETGKTQEQTVIDAMVALEEQLVGGGYLEDADIKDLRDLYSFIPAELHYTGALYRGLGINDSDLKSLLEDKEFRGDQGITDRALESWSSDEEVALSFAYHNSKEEGVTPSAVGIVLVSNTGRQDVVFDMEKKVVEFLLYHLGDEVDYDINAIKPQLTKFLREREIMVYPKDSKYTLCEDVMYLVVHHEYLVIEGMQEELNELRSRLDEGSQVALEGIVELDGDLPPTSVYGCDKQGGMTLLYDYYDGEFD